MASRNRDTWAMHDSHYELCIKTKDLKKVIHALEPRSRYISLGEAAVKLLNEKASLRNGNRTFDLSVEDELLGLKCSDGSHEVDHDAEEMLKLLRKAHQADSEMILLVGRTATSMVKSLSQLRPPYGQKFPSKDNSIFFILRSSTDLSFIKSVNGLGPERIQVWSSSGKVNDRLKMAFELYEHVFCFAMFGDKIWGLLRMSSPPDEAQYGKVKFWCDEEGDETLWSWLGVNWRTQWLCECEVSIDALPRFDENKTNRDFLLSYGNTAKDGACLGDCVGHFWKNEEAEEAEEAFKACWKVANALLQSKRSPHGEKKPRRTKPAPTTRVYDEHVQRPFCAEYNRKNLTSQASSGSKGTNRKGMPDPSLWASQSSS